MFQIEFHIKNNNLDILDIGKIFGDRIELDKTLILSAKMDEEKEHENGALDGPMQLTNIDHDLVNNSIPLGELYGVARFSMFPCVSFSCLSVVAII